MRVPPNLACTVLLLGLALPAVACGTQADGPSGAEEALPQVAWRALRAAQSDGDPRGLLVLPVPARVRLDLEGASPRTLAEDTFAAGNMVEVAWHHEIAELRGPRRPLPPVEEEAAGRTDCHALRVSAALRGGRRLPVEVRAWTRPGEGRPEVSFSPPPVVAETHALPAEIELVRLRVRSGSEPQAPVTEVRLVLRVQGIAPARSQDR